MGKSEFFKAIYPEGGVLAEIGAGSGKNAQNMWNLLNPQEFWLIDLWEYPDTYVRAKKRFADNPHVHLLKLHSHIASRFFPDEHFDGIYINGSRQYETAYLDICFYWKKLKVGGILGGCNYLLEPGINVKPAVDDFCRKNGVELECVTKNRNPSWAIVKPSQTHIHARWNKARANCAPSRNGDKSPTHPFRGSANLL
jgi:hypothetical protein